MHPTLKKNVFFLTVVIAFISSASCSSDTKDDHAVALPPANGSTLRALLKQTQKQMVYVGGGHFIMGEQKSTIHKKDGSTTTGYYSCTVDDGETNTHPVKLDSYSISAYETTYGEQDVWAAFTDSKPVLPRSAGYEKRSSDRPAGTRTWYEAKNYCTWIGDVTGLPFDLPSEAQWEYAARSGGKKVPFATANGRWKDPETYQNSHWRDDPQFLGGHYESSDEHPLPTEPLPVGTFPPNPIGLYDMSGNVYEWVDDWYAKGYYEHSPVNNPQGPKTGKKKILRGGANEQTDYCNTVYARYPQDPVEKGNDIGVDLTKVGFGNRGFRCVLDLDRKLQPGELIKRAKNRGYLNQ